MAVKDTRNPTYLDIASRLGPDYKVESAIVELLAETNQLLEDMVVIEGNLPTGHKTTVRTGLPNATWRLLNYGVQPSKSTTTQVIDECGMLEAYAEVDKDLVKLNGNTAAFRLSEDRAFLEKMNQEMSKAFIYGNRSVDPAKINGIAPRYAAGYTDRWAHRDEIGSNIVPVVSTASGNDQTSIYLVYWGENTVHATYPKGSKLGIEHQDLGEVTLQDAAGGRYQGFRTHYKWDNGLIVRDWRYIVRICNIDWAVITADPSTGDLIDALDDACTLIPTPGLGKPAFYCNSRIESLLRKQVRRNVSGTLTMDQLTENRAVVRYSGIPFRRNDEILNTESPVVFS